MLVKLMLGVRQFKDEPYKKMKALFEQLSTGQHPSTASDYRALMHSFSLLNDNLTSIWRNIKDQVLESLWLELGGLYTSPTDPKFSAMAKRGVYVKLDNLKDFQQNIQESVGYQQYYSELIRHTLFGKSAPLPKLPLVIHHDSYSPSL